MFALNCVQTMRLGHGRRGGAPTEKTLPERIHGLD
jgi:hypothetical protein